MTAFGSVGWRRPQRPRENLMRPQYFVLLHDTPCFCTGPRASHMCLRMTTAILALHGVLSLCHSQAHLCCREPGIDQVRSWPRCTGISARAQLSVLGLHPWYRLSPEGYRSSYTLSWDPCCGSLWSGMVIGVRRKTLYSECVSP